MSFARRNRDGLIEAPEGGGHRHGIHYPIPLHMQKAYASLQYTREAIFRWRPRVAAEIVSLPMFPQLTIAAAGQVVVETAFGRSNFRRGNGEREDPNVLAEQAV